MPDILASIPPSTQPVTNVIDKKVFINGTQLEAKVLISQITIARAFNKIASAKLVFMDGSVADRDFPLSNDSRFKPGNEIKIQLGYDGDVDTVFEGIIVKHGIKIKGNGNSHLLIEAKDKAITLAMTRQHRYHNNKTDKVIIDELAGKLQKDVEATTFSHSQLLQYNCSDWDFIVIRAEANGMMVLTDDGKIVVKKPSFDADPVTATYGDNIWEFESEIDARRQIKEVTSVAWDYSQQTTEKSSNGVASFSENGDLSSEQVAAALGTKLKLSHSGSLTQNLLQDWSNAYAMRSQLSKIAGRVRLKGNADLKPGSIVTLDGVGDKFNGDVFVTGILHHYEGHWQTDVQFGWKDDWFYKKENVMDKPASGLLPGVNGLLIGQVVDVNDTEKGGQYRVKVHVPLIDTGNEGVWARVATLDAGADRGSYFRPQTKDEVVLGFLNDDPREPIVLGYLHSKSNHQSPLPEDSNAQQFGFVTKEKLKFIFDDTNKKMTLLVPAGTGSKSIILNNSGAIELKDENNNSIKMDSSGITIQAGPAKNITIKGTKVFLNPPQ